ncbi:MAG TPA: LysR family transcriptional regulator [Acidimicrobiales bacterium]|nr:LysR family transcriptional regulator [Acidimicrobiales bacterium]
MELRHIRAFLAVAEELHFGKAARRLHIAQPAVSQLVRGLEAEFGVMLFERTSRRVALTSAGESFLDEARELLARHEQVSERMARIGAGVLGEVGVGIVPALPPDLLPSLLTQWRRRLPDVLVVARSLPSGFGATAALDRSDVEIALVRIDVPDPGVSAVAVAREPLGVALAAGDVLAERLSLTAADLDGRAFATFPRTDDPVEFDRLFGSLRAGGLRSHTTHESAPGGVDASLRLVRAALAVSLKLESEVRALGDRGVVWRPLENPKLDVVIRAAWRPDQLGPAGRQLVGVLSSLEVDGT